MLNVFEKKLHYMCLESYFPLKKTKQQNQTCCGGRGQVRMISQEKMKVGIQCQPSTV